MRKFSMKASVIGAVVAMAALTAVSVEPAAAFGGGGFHGGGFGGGGFGGGGFHGGGFHGGWGHHGWGFGHHGWGWAGYGGYYNGGCVLKRYYDEDGDVTVSRVCY